jgi:DNA helicase II / ATP-dependent DNA helicase PcrA
VTKIRRYTLKKPVRSTPYRVRYEDLLNDEQHAVVMAGNGPILVIAGAGSGKTRTLTYRVSRLIEDGVDASRIMLLTFTNKAAREMLSRVEELVETDTRRIWGGTFHAIGNRLIRRHASVLGYEPNFSILDDEDAKEMMTSAISASSVDTLKARFPKGDVLLDIHSYVVNTGMPLEELVEEQHPHFMSWLDQIREVFTHYAARKRAANVMDFDDLLLNWRALLTDHEEVASALAASYQHILVDEYQDTNRIQAEIVDLMARTRKNVMVVGDDAQAIYSFRGASFENIITFPLRWPDCRVFALETNYRSTPEILRLANDSIACNRYQFPKELRAVRPSGPEPALAGLGDVHEQASFVAQRILDLRDEGIALEDIAILYRAHYQSLEIQVELGRRNIPFEVRSGVRFFEQAHVKDVLSFLRILVNPRDELSWKRAMKLFPKVGERTAAAAWSALATKADPVSAFADGFPQSVPKTPRRMREIVRRLASEGMRSSPSESIRLIVDEMYADFARATFPNWQARLDDLEQLAAYALRYDDVGAFVGDVTLDSQIAGEDVAVAGPEDEHVVLSSVHQAKGLEWKAVFVVGLSEGRFPSARAMRVPGGIVRLPERLPDLPVREEGLVRLFEEGRERANEIIVPGEEEERRLFYVAVTRAQQELYLLYPIFARDRMQMDILMEPSRFIRELPVDDYEQWVIDG